jgi:hypothetical protein
MTGDELYVNSGWMWPEGQAPPGAPPIKSFSVTFEKAGTYEYLCEVHPWMRVKYWCSKKAVEINYFLPTQFFFVISMSIIKERH